MMTSKKAISRIKADRDFCSHLKELENLRVELQKTTELLNHQKSEQKLN